MAHRVLEEALAGEYVGIHLAHCRTMDRVAEFNRRVGIENRGESHWLGFT